MSYTLESMIFFQFEPSLRQCSEVVVRPRSYLPVSLVAGNMAFTALLAAAMLEAGTCIDSEPSGSGSAPRAGNTCIVPPFKVNFDLHLRSIGHMPITKKFTENIFTDSRKAAKFVKILSPSKKSRYTVRCLIETFNVLEYETDHAHNQS